MKAYQYFSLTLSLSILYTAFFLWVLVSDNSPTKYFIIQEIIHPQNSSSKSFNDYHRCVLSLIDLLHSIPANIMFYFLMIFFPFPLSWFFFNFFIWIMFCFTRILGSPFVEFVSLKSQDPVSGADPFFHLFGFRVKFCFHFWGCLSFSMCLSVLRRYADLYLILNGFLCAL